MKKDNLFAALRESSFRHLFLAEVFTLISVNIFNFYLIYVVFLLTKSNTAVAGIILSFTVPSIIFGIFAGAYVDMWNKKYVLFATNIIRAVLLIILAFFHTNLYALFIISFLFSVVTQFFIPAESPIIPQIVKKEKLFSANALFSLGIYGSMLVAFLFSVPVILLFGQRAALIFLSSLLIFGGIFIAFMKYKSTVKLNLSKATFFYAFQEVVKTFRLISSSKEVRDSVFLLSLSWVIILVISALAPGYATQVLGISLESLPVYFVGPAVAGVLIGGAVLVHFFNGIRREIIISFGLIFSGFSLMILPFGSRIAARDFILNINNFLPNFLDITLIHLITALAFLLGFANSFVFIPANTILQEQTSHQMRGKVYGILNTIIGVFSLVPLVLAGGLSDIIGVSSVLVVIGVCLLTLGLLRVTRRL